MVKNIKTAVHDVCAALARVAFIFLFLSVGFDAVDRMYFAYMPKDWSKFQSVTLIMRDGEAVAVIQRRATAAPIVPTRESTSPVTSAFASEASARQ